MYKLFIFTVCACSERGRIIKPYMDPSAWEERARLICMTAEGNNPVELLDRQLADYLGFLTGYIAPGLCHGLYSQRVEPVLLYSGGPAVYLIIFQGPCPAFCHLAPTGISGTKKEYGCFFRVHYSSVILPQLCGCQALCATCRRCEAPYRWQPHGKNQFFRFEMQDSAITLFSHDRPR